MLIHELTQDECRQALERTSFGRLACAHDNRPYVLPISFSYDGKDLYGLSAPGGIYAFSTLGRKIEWMRTNPLVCLEVDERISHHDWLSVIVSGRFEELPDAPEFDDVRARALTLLQKRPMWWEPGSVGVEHQGRSAPIFYRIHITEMTGHRASPDSVEAAATAARPPTADESWLGSLLRHWNRTSAFVLFESRQTETHALIKLPRTEQTDALLRHGGVAFSYERMRGRYHVRLGKGDIEKASHLLSHLMQQAQRAGGG